MHIGSLDCCSRLTSEECSAMRTGWSFDLYRGQKTASNMYGRMHLGWYGLRDKEYPRLKTSTRMLPVP